MGAAHNVGVPQANSGTEIPVNEHQGSPEQAATPVHAAGTCLGIDILREIVWSDHSYINNWNTCIIVVVLDC
jgi:hypothetical protein